MTDATPNAPIEGQAQGQGEAVQTTKQATENKAWYEGHSLADEDVGYIQNKNWKSPADVVTSYKNLEKFHGVPAEQLLKLPKDMSDPAALGEIYNRLGRPESPDKYDYKAPEGVQLDEGRMTWAKEVAHKMGLNKQQFAELTNATLAFEGEAIKSYQADLVRKHQAEELELKKEWGSAFEERKILGQRAVRAFADGTPEEKEAILGKIEDAIGTAAVYKLFAKIGESIGDDKIISTTGDTPFGYTPQQALADKKALMAELSDPANKARMDLYNKGQGKDYEKMQQLIKLSMG